MNNINTCNTNEKYVDKNEAMLILGVASHNFYNVASEFAIRIVSQDNRKYFCLEDLVNSKNTVDEFMDKHYPCKYVEEKFFSSRKCEKYGLERIKPPKHYNGLILKHYNHNANTKFFEKAEIDKLVNKIETLHNDKKNPAPDLDNYTKLRSNVYITRKETLNLLDTTDEYLPEIVSSFKIRTKTHTSEKGYFASLSYNLKDLEDAIKSADDFHGCYYSSSHAYALISQNTLDKHNIEPINIPLEIKHIKRTKYNTTTQSMKYYPKKDINNLLEKLDEYIDSKKLAEMLEKTSLNHFDIELFISEFVIKIIHEPNGSYKFYLDDVNNAVKELKMFFENHYFASDAVKIIDRSVLDRRNLKRYDVPKHYIGLLEKSFNTKSKTKVYKKSEVDKLLKERELSIKQKEVQKKADEELQSQINIGELITGMEASKKLSITMESLAKLRKLNLVSYRTNTFGIAGGIYYSANEINLLLQKRNKFFEEYVPFGKPCNKYFNDVDFEYEFVRRTIKKDLKDYIVEVPKYCLGLPDLYGASYTHNGAVKIDVLKDYIGDVNIRVKAKKEAELNRSLVGSTNYKTFELRLTNSHNWEDFKHCSEYTKEKMFEFIKEYFDNSRMKPQNVSSNVTAYMNVASTIKDIIDRHNVEEIYFLSSSQINLYMKTIPNVSTQDILYRFLSSVNYDLMKLGLTSKLKFDFSKIKKPSENREPTRNIDKDIYDFEIYSDVFKYLVDIKKHIPIILEEYNNTKTVTHASIWLYSILHLNNAWRNGDCNRFPDLDIIVIELKKVRK